LEIRAICPKWHLTDAKGFIAPGQVQRRKKGNQKMKAYPTMLLKTHIEKMSMWGYPTMFMKTNDLNCQCHDVYENKGS
jgi:hypothetical protein